MNPVAEFGGAERSLIAWIRATTRALPAAELTLVVPGDGLLARRARDMGVNVRILGLPEAIAGLGDSQLRGRNGGRQAASLLWRLLRAGPAVWLYVRRLRRLLDELRPDLIHSNGIKTHLALRLANWPLDAKKRRPAVVWHVHDFVGSRPMVSRVVRWASRGVAAAVAVSEAVARDSKSVLCDGVRLSVAYNVVDVDRFRPGPGDGRRLDELAGLPPLTGEPQPVRVVLVATYARWKGQDVLLEAAARAVSEPHGPPIRFYIVGGPIYRTAGSQFSQQELREKAQRLGVLSRVGFIDFQDDPAEVYRCGDVIVHASTQPEPFGLTIVEAMACGRAVVVARAGGAAELFTDGQDAVGVLPGDPVALAEAIVRLAHRPEERERLRHQARQTVLTRFCAEGLAKHVTSVYAAAGDAVVLR